MRMMPYQSSHCPEVDHSDAIAGIQRKSKDELRELVADDKKFGAYVKSLPQIDHLNCRKETLMSENKALAEYNLHQKPIIQEKRDALLEKQREARDNWAATVIEQLDRDRSAAIATVRACLLHNFAVSSTLKCQDTTT